MAQTPALFYSKGETIDYTPGSAVLAGAVVVLGSTPLIAPVAIAANAIGSLTGEHRADHHFFNAGFFN